MAISWVAGTQHAYVTSGTSISANLPSGIQDDDEVFCFYYGYGAPVSTPAGWTLVATDDCSWTTVTQTFCLFRKDTVTSGDSGASVSVTQTSSAYAGISFAVVRASESGVLIAEIETDSTSDYTGNSFAAPSLTADYDGEIILLSATSIMAAGTGNTTITAPSGTTLWSGAALPQNRMGCAYKAVDTGGVAGGTFTWSYSTTAGGFTSASLRLIDAEQSGRVSAGSPLGAPQTLGAIRVDGLASDTGLPSAAELVAASSVGWVSESGLPAAPQILGGSSAGWVTAPAILGAPSVRAWNDFTGRLSGTTTYYVMDITGTPSVRVPISSWQATLQTGRQQYAQCVIPAVGDYVDTINDRRATGEFVISRGARFADGTTLEYEMARAPMSTVRLDRGALRYTCTLSGYTAADSGDDIGTGDTVALQSVRTVSVTDTVRVRCAIDWLLRPGMTASAAGHTFTVAYISYYVEAVDSYMDVGERSS